MEKSKDVKKVETMVHDLVDLKVESSVEHLDLHLVEKKADSSGTMKETMMVVTLGHMSVHWMVDSLAEYLDPMLELLMVEPMAGRMVGMKDIQRVETMVACLAEMTDTKLG
jgi:hypothetical protein